MNDILNPKRKASKNSYCNIDMHKEIEFMFPWSDYDDEPVIDGIDSNIEYPSTKPKHKELLKNNN